MMQTMRRTLERVRNDMSGLGNDLAASLGTSRTRARLAMLTVVGYLIVALGSAVSAGGHEFAGRYGQIRDFGNPFQPSRDTGDDPLTQARQAKAARGAHVVDYAEFQELSRRLEAAEEEIFSLRQAQQNVLPAGSIVPPEPAPAGLPAPEAKCDQCFECEPPGGDDPISLPFLTPYSVGEGICYCGDGGDITFKPGFRTQPRYIYTDVNHNNDFLIGRFRLKLGGDAFGIVKYYGELKFDSTGLRETQARGAVENAWLEFKLHEELSYLRVGLYDIPFSRDALTSDSKLLLIDRSIVKNELTEKGFTDNTIGLLFHGRPLGGRFEYAVGIFDNVVFESVENEDAIEDTDELMPAGRFAINLLDPYSSLDGYADYKGSYIGQGQRLSVGVNGVYLGEATDLGDEFELYAGGVDVFYNSGPLVLQAEYDWFVEAFGSDISDLTGDGWYAQGGYLLGCICETAVEVAARYQQFHPEDDEEKQRWTSIGMNFYIRDHNLKIQTEYSFIREETEIDNDVVQVQLQLDY